MALHYLKSKDYGRSGVEMDALVRPQRRRPTVYDMCKALTGIEITRVGLDGNPAENPAIRAKKRNSKPFPMPANVKLLVVDDQADGARDVAAGPCPVGKCPNGQ